MSSTEQWWDTVFPSLSLGVAAFAVIALLVKRFERRGEPVLHLDAMVVFLAVQAVSMADSLLWESPTPFPKALTGLIYLLFPFYMISLWIFVRTITTPNARLYRRDLWHLVPLGLSLLCFLPLLTLPVSLRYALAVGMDNPPETLHVALAALGDLSFWVLWIAILATYSVLCARRLWQHQRNIRALFADLDGRRLWWLSGLVICILVLAWSVVLDELAQLTLGVAIVDGWVQGVQEIIISAGMGFFALRAEPALKPWTAEVLSPVSPPHQTLQESAGATVKDTRYARSGLDTERLARLRRKIDAVMERDRIWRQQGLRLKDLSEITGITPIHLSEVLNTEIGESFYDFINGYRVRDACQLLQDTSDSVLLVSETVGFTSKSTFNTQFKKVTGRTPTAYRDASRKTTAA